MHAFTTVYNGVSRKLVNDVGLSIPFDPNLNTPEPTITVRAIWDTGATMTVLTKKIVRQLNLTPTGKVTVRNTSVEQLRDTYIVNLYLPNKVMIPNVRVTDCEDILGDAELLLGMDIITLGDFAITNFQGKTVLSFIIPSKKKIDYVEEINISNQQNSIFRRIEEGRRRRQINVSERHKKKKR
jgi:predicted aspartyl protease